MNKFATLAVMICAYLAVGNCYGVNPAPGYNSRSNDGSAAAASSASASPNDRSYDIVSGPRPSYGASEILRPVRIDNSYAAGPAGYAAGPAGYAQPAYAQPAYVQPAYQPAPALYAQPAPALYGAKPAYGAGYARPRYTVQQAGATLINPGQNSYRAYVSPPEYSKVVLPVRAAEPVAKLYVPENRSYGAAAPSY